MKLIACIIHEMGLTIVTGHGITRDESLLGRRRNSDATASDWKAIFGWVAKEGFSEEVTAELTPE